MPSNINNKDMPTTTPDAIADKTSLNEKETLLSEVDTYVREHYKE